MIPIPKRKVSEHPTHIGNAARIPSTQTLIKRLRTSEHQTHIGNAARIPRTQTLIKQRRTKEHPTHTDDFAGQHRRHRTQVSCSKERKSKTLQTDISERTDTCQILGANQWTRAVFRT